MDNRLPTVDKTHFSWTTPLLRPRTPAGHPAIAAVWLVSGLAILTAVTLFLAHSFLWPAPGIAGVLGLLAGLLAYLARYARFHGALAEAERLVRSEDLEGARAILSPLLAAYPDNPSLQRSSGILLYAAGDPLSASSLLERALARLGPDGVLVTTLVASYAALNKGGNARRAAATLADDPEVRLALAWSELVALQGDRVAGERITSELAHDPRSRASAGRRAMLGALIAIAEALARRPDRMRDALRELERGALRLSLTDRSFVAYLGAIALRESGDLEGARLTFTEAIDLAPQSIGAALARRERSHLPS